ncbi:hypothetical protein M9458_048882, partial [Cirrhinus mrigala]
VDTTVNNDASTSISTSSSSSSHPPVSVSTHFLDSTHCTCEQGYSISRHNSTFCT